jgi:hypothetical protein
MSKTGNGNSEMSIIPRWVKIQAVAEILAKSTEEVRNYMRNNPEAQMFTHPQVVMYSSRIYMELHNFIYDRELENSGE